ncbi:hypothetical protein ACWGR3_30300 [Streptomyces albidoflavus]
MKTREQALEDLGRVVGDELAIVATLTPREAAERAWHPGGPSVDELTRTIAASRLQVAA